MVVKQAYRIAVGLLFLLITTPLFSQSLSSLESKKKAAEQQISYINSLLSKTGTQRTSNLEQLALLQTKIGYQQDLVRNTEAQVNVINRDISQTRKDITALQKELKNLKDAYASLISAIYTKRRNATWLMYVFASADLSQAYRRLKYFRSFADLAVSQGEQVKVKAATLEEKQKELEVQRKELAEVQKQRETELKELAKDEAKLQGLQKELEKQEKTLRASLQKQQASLRSLNTEIASIMNAEGKKVSRSSTSSSGIRELPAAERELSNRFEANRGKLPWPLKRGVVVLKFGTNRHPLFKAIVLPPNNGIDVSTDAGAAVTAIFAGEVVRVFPFQSYGNCVMIRHGEFFTLYCHLDTIKVKVGDKVNVGDALGVLDVLENGNSVLHFELWKSVNGITSPQNPELWLTSK